MTGTTPKGTARHLRLGLGLAVAAALPFAPGVTRSEGLTLSAAAVVYALGSWVFETIAARRPGFPARVLTPVVGLIVITVVIIAIPRTLEVGLVLFILGAAFTTYVGGRKLGLFLSAGAVSAALVANVLAPESDQIDGATLAAFAVLMPLLVIVVDRLTGERRRTTAALARLHDVLGAVESQPDLAATLDSIAASVGQNVGATVAAVILRDGGSVAAAARATVPSTLTQGEVEWLTQVELEVGQASPLVGHVGRRPILVADIHADSRLAEWSTPWARKLRGLACRKLVVAPLRLGGDVIGVVVAAFARAGRPRKDDLAFLEAYAERASRIVVRARAYDRERTAGLSIAEAARAKGEFLALVSHELRTPLTAVKGFVDTVLLHWNELPDDRRRELLDRASANADELNRLVGQLLDFSRLDAARTRLSPRPLPVSEVVTRVLDDLGAALVEHRVDVDADGAVVFADENAFGHVLMNLLTNAAKFSPSDAPITVRAESANGDVVVSVADHGVGIALEEQDRIFERFYQSPSNMLTRRGTGIGLTIAKEFTEIQGGRIRVESMPGVGSTFFVTMPSADVSAPDAERAEVAT